MKNYLQFFKKHKHKIVLAFSLITLLLVLFLLLDKKATDSVEIALGSSGYVSFQQDNTYHSSEKGLAIIKSADKENKQTKETPQTVWVNDSEGSYNFTMPEKAKMEDSSIGILTIPKINLSAQVYESDNQMEDMENGIAHFKHTSAWNGLVGLSAHNINLSGSNGLFLNIYQLKVGDKIQYETALGNRKYVVIETKTINQSDWSDLERSDENRIVLITCISGQPQNRLCVVAKESIDN